MLARQASGQGNFRAVLINAIDSTTVRDAAITIPEINKTVITNSNGLFEFNVPATYKQLSLRISAIGCKTTVTHVRTFDTLERVYVEILPSLLNDFTVVGLSAADVVKKAVAAIPGNYADSSYFSYSSYRQYQVINGRYRNLLEAKPVVLFNLRKTPTQITSKEAFAVTQTRRSEFAYEPGRPELNNIADLFADNPIYHLEEGSLLPGRFDEHVRFAFDTTEKVEGCYVINYLISGFSLETHGVFGLYRSRAFRGESWEKGKLIIERNGFAIRYFERYACRHKGYTYPRFNNLVYPAKKYFMNFTDAVLTATYAPKNGRWYLETLTHQYTNEFYRAQFATKDYVVTCFYEWRQDSATRYTTEEYKNNFNSRMLTRKLGYDPSLWTNDNFPFLLHRKDDVYKDLQHAHPIDSQFVWSAIRDME